MTSVSKKIVFGNHYILLAILLVFWGSFAAVSKLMLTSIDSYQMQFYMFGFAFLVMTFFLISGNRMAELRALKLLDLIKLMLYSLPGYFYYFFYTLALSHIPVVEASMLNYSFPIMIVLFAVPINNEKLDSVKIVSIILGFIGMVVLVTNGNFDNLKLSNLGGDLLAVGAAICWGIYSNLGKRNQLDLFMSNYICSLVSFILSIVSLIVFSRFSIPDLSTSIGIIWVSAGNIIFTFLIWFKVLKKASSSLVASITFITPVITLSFIAILIGDKVSIWQLAGIAVILSGIFVQSVKQMACKGVKDSKGVY